MASLPANRQSAQQGTQAPAPLPTRVQYDNFGPQQGASSGGALVPQSRAPQPRPAVTTSGPAQGRESFASVDGKLDGPAVARALNAIQGKVADSTAQARAGPLANGRLFQNVPIIGTLTTGTIGARPARTGLPDGFLYFITLLEKPIWLSGTRWVDATGAMAYPAATIGDLATTAIDHGFGTPAAGFIITNVQNAVIQLVPRIVPAGDSTDKNTVRIWIAYAPLSSGGSPTADFYVYY